MGANRNRYLLLVGSADSKRALEFILSVVKHGLDLCWVHVATSNRAESLAREVEDKPSIGTAGL